MASIVDPLPIAICKELDNARPFRFFDLPRELRDWCYDYMIGPTVQLSTLREIYGLGYDSGEESDIDSREESDTRDRSDYLIEDECALKLAISAPPVINLLCVSREMKMEYEQRAAKQTELIVHDHGGNDGFQSFEPGAIHVPHFKWVTKMKYFGVVHCKDTIDCEVDTLNAASWIRATISMLGSLNGVQVNLALQCVHPDNKCTWPRTTHISSLPKALREMTEAHPVTRLRVFGCGDHKMSELPEDFGEDMLYVEWTTKDGWVAPKSV